MKKVFAILLFAIAFTSSSFAQKEKLTAADVIAKHLASIGTPEALKAAKSRVLVGQGALTSQLGYAGRIIGHWSCPDGFGRR